MQTETFWPCFDAVGLALPDSGAGFSASCSWQALEAMLAFARPNAADEARLGDLMDALLASDNPLLWWLFARSREGFFRQSELCVQHTNTDALTGALNGAGFKNWLLGQIGKSDGCLELSFICIDLVNFKRINDQLSYHVGDEVIKSAVEQLRGLLCCGGCVVIRFSGDELALALAGPPEAGRRLLRRLHGLQVQKLKNSHYRRLWQSIKKAQLKSAGTELEVRAVFEEKFGQELAAYKQVVFIGGEPVLDLGDLVLMACGLAYGKVSCPEDCTAVIARAEQNMQELKHRYHELIGGAYRRSGE